METKDILLFSFNIVLPQSRTSPFLSHCQLFCSFFSPLLPPCPSWARVWTGGNNLFFFFFMTVFSWEDVQLPVSAQVGSAQV